MNSDDVYHDKNCSGCTACMHRCPTGAINMSTDSKGFSYPVIDSGKCTSCNLCRKICPAQNSHEGETQNLCYAARVNDNDVLRNSSSGGAAYALSENMIGNGGVVYGAAFDDDLTVRHIRIDSIGELRKLQGSKYVQSDLTGIFTKIENDLMSGKEVLFIGTPCQITGLNAAVRKPELRHGLTSVSLICYGVPSPMVWKQFINEEIKNPGQVCMRDKVTGWEHSAFSITVNNRKKTEASVKNSFMRAFFNNLSLREICFTCPYKGGKRHGDITLGDCWGQQEMLLDVEFDDMGMSVLFPNTEKGCRMIESCRGRMQVYQIDYQEAIQHNLMMLKSVDKSVNRESFFHDLKYMSLKKAVYKYVPDDPFILKIKKKLYPIKEYLMRKK